MWKNKTKYLAAFSLAAGVAASAIGLGAWTTASPTATINLQSDNGLSATKIPNIYGKTYVAGNYNKISYIGGPNGLWYSTDEVTFKKSSTISDPVMAIEKTATTVYANGTAYGTGAGRFYYSKDGINFHEITKLSGASHNVNLLGEYDNKTFIVDYDKNEREYYLDYATDGINFVRTSMKHWVRGIKVHNNVYYLLVDGYGFYSTTDFKTFTHCSNLPNSGLIDWVVGQDGNLYVINNSDVYLSSDWKYFAKIDTGSRVKKDHSVALLSDRKTGYVEFVTSKEIWYGTKSLGFKKAKLPGILDAIFFTGTTNSGNILIGAYVVQCGMPFDLLYSSDGINFKVGVQLSDGQVVDAMYESVKHHTIFINAMSAGFYYSTNDGASFSHINSIPTTYFGSVGASSSDDVIYFANLDGAYYIKY